MVSCRPTFRAGALNTKNAVADAFAEYLKALKEWRRSEKTEHTDRSAIERLLKTFAEFAEGRPEVQHEPKRIAGKGAPDFKVTKAGNAVPLTGRRLDDAIGSRLVYFQGVDTRTPEQRSRIMRSVGTKHTGPELIVRKLLHALGCRYALHRKDLPGSPDIVMPSRRKVVFVHGCFWHGHKCRYGRSPKSRPDYWVPKVLANSRRDRRNRAALIRAGWSVLVIWQCQTRHPERLRAMLLSFVDS